MSTERIRQPQSLGNSYGSTGNPVTSPGTERDWHSLGSPFTLLATAGISIGRQCVALGLIIASVFFNYDYLMSCNPMKVGWGMATFCEYNKAYVRCFPLLALILTLLVSSRQLLQHRMYYELLKHGVLLDIENFSALSDPLFWIILWCAANAFSHYIIDVWITYNLNLAHPVGTAEAIQGEEFMAEAQQIAVFYMVPSLVLIMYIYSAYDVESNLLSLSKYFEEDPAEARQALGQMPFIKEDVAAAAVAEMIPAYERVDLPPSANAAYGLFVSTALGKMEDQVQPLSRWRLASTMWPAKFLLHRSLNDEDSRSFRKMWYLYSGFSLLIMIAVFSFFMYSLIDKSQDVIVGPIHQWTDIAGVLVTAGFVAMNLWLALGLMKNLLVPFRT